MPRTTETDFADRLTAVADKLAGLEEFPPQLRIEALHRVLQHCDRQLITPLDDLVGVLTQAVEDEFAMLTLGEINGYLRQVRQLVSDRLDNEILAAEAAG